MKPRLLDLFCGAGGCTKGYQDAGFHVVGVDLSPQPNYCGDGFLQMDALEYLEHIDVASFDAIHASPPCQGYTSMGNKHPEAKAAHPTLIAPIRELLKQTGLPYVIENVGGAVHELKNPTQVCGRSLGLTIHRHRLFETNFPFMVASCTGGRDPFGIYGKLDGRRLWTRSDGSELHAASTLEEAQVAMEMPWADWHGVKEAVPPRYTEHIGHYLLAAIERMTSQNLASLNKRPERREQGVSQTASSLSNPLGGLNSPEGPAAGAPPLLAPAANLRTECIVTTASPRTRL